MPNQDKKILVLDDDPDVISLLKLRLDKEGYQVFTGTDGLQGLMKVRGQMPDLIIMDVMMPNLNGREFYKKMKDNEETAMIPIIVMTGHPFLRAEFEKMRCDYFAVKPIHPGEIMPVIRNLLKQKVLIVGEYKDFQHYIQSELSEDYYESKIVEQQGQMFEELAAKRYDVAVVRLAQVEDSAEEFISMVERHSLNKRVLVVIYSDAYVKGTEEGDAKVIIDNAIKWVMAGRVLFFDPRTCGPSLFEFMKDHLGKSGI
ncbi:MAG: hypothetical protein A3G33_04535 [Omnitrophica bacterium RIFCSPLOWO2_12_FULL_44_17]|uniref:Response regulatory domain-containing protein n=1 Tax=Candidatus Danuiimicrobium aquiferis TaxID=1801832 RepID=A0A1G1KQU0_9BACT|nr:MAG: hypothetical protein A3B72_10745 [Omnitrophica bacterium RIFCSPHIGHO2_02_FULL_45_28]OGW88408.1 MAG: hypothetical protein A3E74_08955 [Omnitrophica bacterium RIFCSPHIGHO2_12_FULL_44_12]OGW95202.1 MAG: hypothetical protein A3G33_04535 [Omnitrophica bacterium RIFCSPLOWO2_12_FULL_44_17]OGX01653.1 MAG: hypothetical protein A3J12_03900 [Omnitrophica bacterium RIFCSPLOWO2_02_FULL_44_11]